MSTTRADVLAMLAEHAPKELSITALAALMDRPTGTVGSLCSKLYFYGKVDRRLMPGHKCQFLYRSLRNGVLLGQYKDAP